MDADDRRKYLQQRLSLISAGGFGGCVAKQRHHRSNESVYWHRQEIAGEYRRRQYLYWNQRAGEGFGVETEPTALGYFRPKASCLQLTIFIRTSCDIASK